MDNGNDMPWLLHITYSNNILLQFGQFVFYFNVIYYCVFIELFTGFMLYSTKPHDPSELSNMSNNPKYTTWEPLERFIYVTIFTHSTTIHDLILNGTINYTIYGECEWVSSNLMMKKASWQTTVSIIIIVVSASRLLLEIIELFQVGFAAPRFE